MKPTNTVSQDWDINPNNYQKNIDGSFVLKKDGTPKKKSGRPLGSKDTLQEKIKKVRKKEKLIKTLMKQVEKESFNLPYAHRTSSSIPFGYKLNVNTKRLEPIEKELNALKKVEEQILNGRFSLRDGVQFLLEKTQRQLSAPGLKKIMEKKYGVNCCSEHPKKEKGWIYTVTTPSYPGWVKFGKSINLESRLAQYNSHNPLKDYEFLEICPSDDTKEAEKIVLNIASFFANEEKGEWKKIDFKLAENIIQQYSKKYETH